MVSLWNETKCLLCDLVKGECLWPREVVGLPDVRGRVLKYRGRDAGNVGSREGGDPSVCCGATKYTVAPNHGDKEVRVEVVAQECVRDTGVDDVLFGCPVVAGEREGCIGSCLEEGEVDDVLQSGFGGCVDECAVLVQPLGALRSGHHEEELGPCQCVS